MYLLNIRYINRSFSMRPYKYALVLFAILLILNTVSSEYWFQVGAKSGSSSIQNGGASIVIQTITPQNIRLGSVAYWVGEDLNNGAFIQMGYLIENQSASYPSYCGANGCSGYQNLNTGDAEWFYEYFPSTAASTFLGAIGPDGSAGTNGTFNTYSFYAKNNTWYFAFDGNVVGNVSLGTDTSGDNVPLAFGEVANTTISNQQLVPVTFRDLSFYANGTFLLAPNGYSYIGYGEGSSVGLRNLYGVNEAGNKINDFIVGSGIPQLPNNTQLWTLGYMLTVISNYGNMHNSTEYFAYSRINLSTPNLLYANSTSRGIFTQWYGSGYGSYTGAANSINIFIGSNITEYILRQPQYFLNISSAYENTAGSGWYNANSTAHYSISSNVFYSGPMSRLLFSGWSNGQSNISATTVLYHPETISANWEQQYLVNATADYGGINGTGWHGKNSIIAIYPSLPVLNINSTARLAFYSWNNGSKSPTLYLNVTGPFVLHAIYKKQYLTKFIGTNANGDPIIATGFILDNNTINGSAFLYSNVTYSVNSAYFDGFKLSSSKNISVSSSSTVYVQLPLYPVSIATTDIFGIPVNASVRFQLENGTYLKESSGSGGEIIVQNVPYGEATGSALFSGINESFSASNGSSTHLIFISGFDIEVFIVAIAIAVFIYIIASKNLHKPKVKPTSGSESQKVASPT